MPLSRKKKVKHYLAMWDMLGLECIFDVGAAKDELENWEKETIWSTLKEEAHRKKPNPIPLPMLLLRARMNSHRSYEIYEFSSTMTMEEIKEVFKDDPQVIVDWIRENGYKVYSDYVKRESKMIA
jgi:hypothetical protein